MSATIDILLATYNAQDYLPMLLRSLQNQTMDDFRVLVHDDGSTDSTLSILRQFAAADARIILIEDGQRFGSAQGNFLHLLAHATAPFCIFCDDDDIWLENKLEVLYHAIRIQDNTKPQAVWCNSYVYEPTSGHIGGHATLTVPRTLPQILFCNSGIQGCAILFNEALREKCLPAPDVVAMHDHLLTLAALTFGQLTYIPQRLMLYRRYEGTVTGQTDKTLRERMHTFRKHRQPVIDQRHYRAVESFYTLRASEMAPAVQRIYEQYFRFVGRNRLQNAYHVYHDGFSLYGSRTMLAVKMLLRPLINPQ